MARCMGRTRSGRRCRRESLKGSTRCSIHMPKLVMSSNNRGLSKMSSAKSNRTARGATKGISSIGRTGVPASRRIINPAFYQLSTDNPLLQHYMADKVGDFSRTANVGVAANVATMPMLYGGGPGLAAKIGTSLVATILIGGVLNTVDQYRDLYNFATTGEIHGHSVIGRTHQ